MDNSQNNQQQIDYNEYDGLGRIKTKGNQYSYLEWAGEELTPEQQAEVERTRKRYENEQLQQQQQQNAYYQNNQAYQQPGQQNYIMPPPAQTQQPMQQKLNTQPQVAPLSRPSQSASQVQRPVAQGILVETPFPTSSGVYCPNPGARLVPLIAGEINKVPKNLPQAQHPELSAYLKVLVTDNKFNKYCVDCMKDKTSYVVMNYGVFICESCAYQHLKNFPQQKHYLKEIFTEVFDPFQIRVLQFSQNKNFYELLKEYGIEKEIMVKKYTSPAAKWYKRQLRAYAAGTGFAEPKPKKEAVAAVNQEPSKVGFSDKIASLFK